MGFEEWSNNLPEQFTSFVGRAREREEVRAALAGTRLLTLTGAGGSGKTRLALQVAADCGKVCPDGAWWVDLAPLSDRESVTGALAGVLGVRPLPGRTPLQAAVDRLARHCALVVLDNCEHVLAWAADLSEALMRGAPRVALLATSRERLGVPGESEWRVPPLSASDACGLFVERAAKVRSGFALNSDNTPLIARICREVDGLPLAIELAAPRVRMLSVEQIADRLSDRFRLLTGGPRGTVERQQTLRASVDWSYELLSEPERLVFRRLAVFIGGWSLEATQAVCAGDGVEESEVLDLLSALVDKSLVVVAQEADRAARYRLLETVRQYALELLERSGEEPALRDRQLDFFLALAERAAVELETPQNLEWLDRLDRDAANIDGAIRHATEISPEAAIRLAVGVTMWWNMRGRLAAGQRALERALEAAGPEESSLRARGLWSRGHLASYRGDYEAAVASVRQALAVAQSIGDDSVMARALFTLTALGMPLDPRGTRPAFRHAIELAGRTGDEWTLMSALTTLAWSYLMTEEFAEAELVFAEAAPAVERTGLEGVAWSALGLGWCALGRSEHARALELFERAVAAARELGDPVTQGFAHVLMARLELMQGRAAVALERARASEAALMASGTFMVLPSTRVELARAHAALGDVEAARALLEVVVAGGADGGWTLCEALLALADALRAVGDPDGALARARQALELGERLGADGLAASAREQLARVAIGAGEPKRAEALVHAALAQRVAVHALDRLPQCLDSLAQVACALESHTDGARLLGAAERARSKLGLARWPPEASAFEALEATLASQLGSGPYLAARAEGAAMSLDEAVDWVSRARGTRRRPPGGWDSLTPTEARVVELVSQGLTNPQVAERMFVSRATVKAHLSHIFQKLEVSSRSELAALAVRRSG